VCDVNVSPGSAVPQRAKTEQSEKATIDSGAWCATINPNKQAKQTNKQVDNPVLLLFLTPDVPKKATHVFGLKIGWPLPFEVKVTALRAQRLEADEQKRARG
jgi:hypothetical protein